MRRSILKKLVASIVLVAAIIFSGLPTFAQSRSHHDERNRKEKRKYSKRTKGHKHDKKRDYHVKKHKKHRHHHDKYTKVRSRHYHGDHYRGHHKSHRYDRHNHYGHGHHKHAVRRYYKRHGHRCYSHSRYGNVVVRFSVRPTIINHCDGDFYYARGRYYQYYPEVGYIRVEAPESICFDNIPDACERVSYRGGVYFRLGDLSFVKNGRGFRLAGSIEL